MMIAGTLPAGHEYSALSPKPKKPRFIGFVHAGEVSQAGSIKHKIKNSPDCPHGRAECTDGHLKCWWWLLRSQSVHVRIKEDQKG